MYYTKLNQSIKIGTFNAARVSLLMENNGGLNLSNYELVELNKTSLTECEVDIFIVHGYELREYFTIDYETNIADIQKIKCDSFVIDLMGEYWEASECKYIFNIISELNIKCNNIKLVGIYDTNDPIVIEGVDIFKYDFPSLFFTGPHNDTFNEWHILNSNGKASVWMGGKYKESKEKVFLCLNNQMRPHRVVLMERMAKSNKICQHGVISSRVGKYHKHSSPLIKVDDIVGDGTEKRFGLQTQFSNKCYVDVVTETHFGTKFITEKSVKPFMLLQFPIIFGYSGIIQYFRDKGFDMFDDIIDHSYDKLDSNQLSEKSDTIVTELERLCDLDWKKLNKDNKHRLELNQKLLNKYNIESKRTEAIANFIFSDNYTFSESTLFDKEYVS